MKKRFLLGMALGMFIPAHSFAGATTTDVSMQIQSLLDQYSQVRTLYKQVASAQSRQALLQNMGKDAYNKLGSQALNVAFGKTKMPTAKELGTLILPDKLKDATDDVKKYTAAFKEYMTIPEDADSKDLAQKREEQRRFQYLMYATGYGRSLVARRRLDEKMKMIEKLREEAENAQTEAELASLSNKLGILQLEQMETAQMLGAMRDQAENFVMQMSNYNNMVTGKKDMSDL